MKKRGFSSRRALFTSGCMLVLLLGVAAPLATQQLPVTDLRPRRVIQGEDLPELHLVRGFLESIFWRYSPGHDRWRALLKEFNVQEDGAAAKALARAALRGAELRLDTLDVSPYAHDRELHRKVQHEWLRKQVRATSRVWLQFLQEWQEAGQPPEAITAYIDRKVRPGMSLLEVGDP